jgi:regulator of protease activity HflC (stomatin/prohibitin superfamily)
LTEALQYYLPRYFVDKQYQKIKNIISITLLAQVVSRRENGHPHGPQIFHVLDIPELGMYFIGITPFNSLKYNAFKSKTVRETSKIVDGIITIGSVEECSIGGYNTPLTFIYATQSPSIELKDNTKAGVITQTTLYFMDLYKALYSTEQNGGFMSNVHTVQLGTQRELVAEMAHYEELVSSKSEIGASPNNEKTYADKFKERMGNALVIYGIGTKDVDLVDHHPADIETANAIAAKQKAERKGEALKAEKKAEGEAELLKGEFEAKTTLVKGQAEAEVIGLRQKKLGEALKETVKGLNEAAGVNPEIAVAALTAQGMKDGFGEGPTGTRPNVVSTGGTGVLVNPDKP